MELEVSEREGNIARVTLVGRLDTSGVDRCESRFNAAVVAAKRDSVVDLSGVDFVASMGLRMFIAAARAAKLTAHTLVLFAPQPRVKEVLDQVSLAEIIPIVETEAEALSLLRRVP